LIAAACGSPRARFKILVFNIADNKDSSLSNNWKNFLYILPQTYA
jgi:hypothetical protein